VLLDDWYQLTWWRHHDFGLSAIWEYGHYNYFHFNPRVGDVFLLIVNGPTACHLILTPLVEVGLLWVTFALAFARWPRATLRDLQLLLFVQVMIWIVIPIPGIIYFYRPFATNYLWAFATTLALFVPYRFAMARAGAEQRPRIWLAPLLFVVGWLAGMSNEHTGPTAMLAMAAFVYAAWRTKRLRAWMLAGAAGLYIGYPMLFFAPGQTLRYAGLATRYTPLRLIAERGFSGCGAIVLDFLAESQVGVVLFVVATLLYIRALRRRGAAIPPLAKSELFAGVGMLAGAFMIVATLFASPTASERLFFAPGILLVAALAVFAERMFDERPVRRFLVWTCSLVFAYHVVRFVGIYWLVKGENDERMAALRAAKPGTVAQIEPFKHIHRSRWYWGDDFRYASLREYVGNEVFDLAGIQFTKHQRWAEPPAPDRYVARRVYDPPLPPDVAPSVAPLPYTPTYWEWTIVQLRRALAFTNIGDYQGHKLVRYTIEAVDTELADPKHRPIFVVDWTPRTGFQFVDGRPYDDGWGRPYVRVWADSVPAGLVDSYVVDCGETHRVEPLNDAEEHVGPLLPVDLSCRGVHTSFMCEAERCWLSGRYWR
jgi:uncharacterized protein DUF6056